MQSFDLVSYLSVMMTFTKELGTDLTSSRRDCLHPHVSYTPEGHLRTHVPSVYMRPKQCFIRVCRVHNSVSTPVCDKTATSQQNITKYA